jgi:hypothetical protein
LCGFEDCSVNVKFDDRPIRKFRATGPSDHSTTIRSRNPCPVLAVHSRSEQFFTGREDGAGWHARRMTKDSC